MLGLVDARADRTSTRQSLWLRAYTKKLGSSGSMPP